MLRQKGDNMNNKTAETDKGKFYFLLEKLGECPEKTEDNRIITLSRIYYFNDDKELIKVEDRK